MPMIWLSLKSLRNRKTTALLTIFSIAISVMLLLGVERIKNKAKNSFASTISGTDLIVGARSGTTQLLLYSIFRIGNATNNVGSVGSTLFVVFPGNAAKNMQKKGPEWGPEKCFGISRPGGS